MSAYSDAASGGPPGSSFDRVIRALERAGSRVERRGPNEVMASCPVPGSEDRNPSLHVTYKSGEGQTLLKCFSCEGPASDHVAVLGLEMGELWDRPLEKKPDRKRLRTTAPRRGNQGRLPNRIATPAAPAGSVDHPHDYATVTTYPYVDADGVVVQHVLRQHCRQPDCAAKNFPSTWPVGERSVKTKPKGFRPWIYRAPEVKTAIDSQQAVWLFEGEKDAERGVELELVATTNPGGAGAFTEVFVPQLAGAAELHVVLDRDKAGYTRGLTVAELMGERTGSLRLLLPMTETPKSDFSDHLDAGYTVGDLVEVSTTELTAAITAIEVDQQAQRVDQDLAEIRAHHGAATQAATAKTKAATHQQRAARWAQAAEVQLDQLRSLVERAEATATEATTTWPRQLAQLAQRQWQQTLTAARATFTDTGQPLPPVLRPAPATPPPPPDPTDPGTPAESGSGETLKLRGDLPQFKTTYRVDQGMLVAETTRRDRQGEQTETTDVILNLDVRLAAIEFVENDEDDADTEQLLGREHRQERKAAPPPREIFAYVVEYVHPDTGELLSMSVRPDDWAKCTWLDALPGPPHYAQTQAGRARVLEAIKYVGKPRVIVRYRRTGWRRNAEHGAFYLHAGGGITASGEIDVNVHLPETLQQFDLPAPSTDPEVIRAAFLDHADVLRREGNPRVFIPLLGLVFRSVLGQLPPAVGLVGSPNTYKTGVAAMMMNFLGERWDRSSPATSLSGNGATTNAMRVGLAIMKDTIYFADDAAPTRGYFEASRRITELFRMVYNREARDRMGRAGEYDPSNTPAKPVATFLITSEVMPEAGSGATRFFPIHMRVGDVDKQWLMAQANPKWARYQRALLTASLIQWMAGRLDDIRDRFRAYETEYGQWLLDTRSDLTDRQAEALAGFRTGWALLMMYLTEVGALTVDEIEQLELAVDDGIAAAADAAMDPDRANTTAAVALETIRHALGAHLAHVVDVQTGAEPSHDLAEQMGWRLTKIGPIETRADPKGQRLGFIDWDKRELLCDKLAVEAVIKEAGGKLASGLQVDATTIARALESDGALVLGNEMTRTGAPRLFIKRRHPISKRPDRFLVIKLDRLFPDDSSEGGVGPDGQDGSAPPAPTVPEVIDLRSGPPPGDPPSPGDEQTTMIEYRDADAVAMQPLMLHAPTPCLVCHQPTTARFDKLPLHHQCFEATTAQLRTLMRQRDTQATPAAQAPLPAQSAADPGAATAVLAAPPAQASAQSAAQPPVDVRERQRGPKVVGAVDVNYVGPAAVLTGEGLHLPDGQIVDPGPLRHAGDIAALAERFGLGARYRGWERGGQIWVSGDLLTDRWGIDLDALEPAKLWQSMAELTQDLPLVVDAKADGWSLSGKSEGLGAWTRVWREDRKERRGDWVVLMPAVRPEDCHALADDPDPTTLAKRLTMYAVAVKFPWTMSPGASGMEHLTRTHRRDKGYFTPGSVIKGVTNRCGETDFSWSRQPVGEELQHQYVIGFDRSSSYASAANIRFGVGDPQHHPDGRSFDKAVYGYWRVEVPQAEHWGMPHPLWPSNQLPAPGHGAWLTTPTLEMAQLCGYEPQILEAWTWSEDQLVLGIWYTEMKAALNAMRDSDDPDRRAVERMVKEVYKRTFGRQATNIREMQSHDGFAPDRWHHIVAKARFQILYRIRQIGEETGRWPVAVGTDTIVYTSNDPDPASAWPGEPKHWGTGGGQYKFQGGALLADHLQHLTGRGYGGLSKLTKDWPAG